MSQENHLLEKEHPTLGIAEAWWDDFHKESF